MFLRFFRSTGAQIIIAIPFFGLLLWLRPILKAPDVTFLFDNHPMPLYKFVTDMIPYTSFYGTILTYILVIMQGFLLVRLNTRFIFINNRSYLPAFFFIFISACIPDLQRLNPVIFSGFFLLLALEKIFESYKAEKIAYEFFLAAFFVSIGSLFYPFLLFFLFTLWIGLGILRPFNWREWVFTILGFLIPQFFIFSFYYLVHNDPVRLFHDYTGIFEASYKFHEYNLPILTFMGYMAIISLLASQFMVRSFQSKKILPRKGFIVFLWLFINCVAVFIFIRQASVELIFIASIPLSYLLAHFFALMKSTFWGNAFLLVMILILVWIQVWG
jgi:hypothetical protein